MIFGIALGCWLVFVVRRRVRRGRPLRQALSELGELNQALAFKRLTPMRYLDRVNALLKRLLIHAYGAQEVAELSSDAWARTLGQFLHRCSKPDAAQRIETSLLGEFRYRPYSHQGSEPGLDQNLQSACERLGANLERVFRALNPPEAPA